MKFGPNSLGHPYSKRLGGHIGAVDGVMPMSQLDLCYPRAMVLPLGSSTCLGQCHLAMQLYQSPVKQPWSLCHPGCSTDGLLVDFGSSGCCTCSAVPNMRASYQTNCNTMRSFTILACPLLILWRDFQGFSCAGALQHSNALPTVSQCKRSAFFKACRD